MRFRPCIDLHQGKVKQLIGDSVFGEMKTKELFVSKLGADYFAKIFQEDKLSGGHVIMIGDGNVDEALKALEVFPGGMQIGGGITRDNAPFFLEKGASHIIVTSYIFSNETLNMENLNRLVKEVGKEKIVIDLSCKKQEDRWYVASKNWRDSIKFELNLENIRFLENYCDEFLIHAVDVEGKQEGIDIQLVKLLSKWASIPTTYAGGVGSLSDLSLFHEISSENINITIGSALDIYGGKLSYREVLNLLETNQMLYS
ncbi:phosphoribosylformimino-5-aminoimidazole carboxamide ribotide isomerase [Paenibacillus sp. 1011MAR3C5]|uniref:phosphoribosylformimino-5-aminoimidazole carboxamide ribotide isomerase n=1 Tax=Paenibacillus sp. 1011MAR3C5 TaxID=1675787 RepID=UPI000E6C7373|nr:phosphoribosylformimino-5-aminoimidazole carboxamide ribotide isomerase [Paenibacillus sp. 1011MAR3C5]RJE89675.1 phosphoribosylformimino-5-aminoimidazole carboxamide ribotide isomerase [Paenibacillus sp. 1011MAR3C5]